MDIQIKIKEIDLPEDSLIYHGLEETHYRDVFQAEVVSEQSLQVEEIAVLFFDVFPSWFRFLFKIRNIFAKLVGLDSVSGNKEDEEKLKRERETGERVGLFNVIERTKEEIYMGENDKHLNFRASIFLKKKNDHYLISMATIVHFNNWLGRAYFVPVKIVHRLVIPLLLKRAVRKALSP